MLEELRVAIQHLRRHLLHLMGPLRENLLCRLVEEADLSVRFTLLGGRGTLIACLQVVTRLVQRAEGVPDVLGSLCCNTHILSKSPHLLVQVDVALFGLRGGFCHLPAELASDLFYLFNAKIDPAIWGNELIK